MHTFLVILLFLWLFGFIGHVGDNFIHLILLVVVILFFWDRRNQTL